MKATVPIRPLMGCARSFHIGNSVVISNKGVSLTSRVCECYCASFHFIVSHLKVFATQLQLCFLLLTMVTGNCYCTGWERIIRLQYSSSYRIHCLVYFVCNDSRPKQAPREVYLDVSLILYCRSQPSACPIYPGTGWQETLTSLDIITWTITVPFLMWPSLANKSSQ